MRTQRHRGTSPNALIRSRHGAGFRDQHKQEIQNYALSAKRVEFFSAAHREDSALSNRSSRNNQSKRRAWRGFRLPGANEGQ